MENFFVYFYSKKIPQNFLLSNKQKVTSNEQKVTNKEQKVTRNEQKLRRNEQRAKSFTSMKTNFICKKIYKIKSFRL